MENMNLSDKSKEALKSETWKELGEALREEIVKGYLKAGYTDESKQHDIEVSGTIYKVLERGKITTFYDGFGNTLFNVENKELAAKYDELAKAGNEPDPVDEKEAAPDDGADNDVIFSDEDEKLQAPAAAEVADSQKEDGRPAKSVAKEKLEKELNNAKDKSFAEPVIGYLLERCEEEGFAQDVAQEHKTWSKCVDYIYKQAKKQATNNRAVVRNDVVYEWAEDYYRKDDKAEEQKKAKREKEAAEKKAVANDKTAKAAVKFSPNKDKQAEKPAPAKEEKPKEPAKPKKNGKEMEGQIDMFSMMGM